MIELGDFRRHLPSHFERELTQAEAKALVRQAADAVLDEPMRREAARLVGRSRAAVEDRERKARREKLRREESEREAAKAKKAWRRLYGRKVADQLQAWAGYDVFEVQGLVLAYSTARARAAEAVLHAANFPIRRLHAGLRGAYLGRDVPRLDGADLAHEDLLALVREQAEQDRQRQAERQTQEGERRERAAAKRERERETARFGVAVGDE